MKRNRCSLQECNKKLKLFEESPCKCGLFFCMAHRFADLHNCSYDYKQEQKEKIKKENPAVINDKIVRI
jgi:hypothetical protein